MNPQEFHSKFCVRATALFSIQLAQLYLLKLMCCRPETLQIGKAYQACSLGNTVCQGFSSLTRVRVTTSEHSIAISHKNNSNA